MSVQVDDNWWKHFFDEVYLLTDARSVCDEELTSQEVDFLEETLGLDKPLLFWTCAEDRVGILWNFPGVVLLM